MTDTLVLLLFWSKSIPQYSQKDRCNPKKELQIDEYFSRRGRSSYLNDLVDSVLVRGQAGVGIFAEAASKAMKRQKA